MSPKMTEVFKTIGPSDDDAMWGRVHAGLDIPKYDADMSHWLQFDVDPPPLTYTETDIQMPKEVQPRVERLRWWRNPRVFFNSFYKCSAGNISASGEIDNEI